jgi:Lysozyme like domain
VANLTYAQLEGLWIKAGGPQPLAPVAAAIAEAESGGNPGAVNPNDNGGRQSSFGLWQISTGTHTPPSPNWADPATNAQLAVAKFRGAGNTFSPWGTYDSGAYRAYLSPGTTPDTNVSGNPAALTAQLTAATQADCLIGFSGVPGTSWINDLFGSGGNVGSFCLLSRSQARGWIGAALLAGGTAGFALAAGLLIYVAGQRTVLGAAGFALLQRRQEQSLTDQEKALDERDKAAKAQRQAAAPRARRTRTGP